MDSDPQNNQRRGSNVCGPIGQSLAQEVTDSPTKAVPATPDWEQLALQEPAVVEEPLTEM